MDSTSKTKREAALDLIIAAAICAGILMVGLGGDEEAEEKRARDCEMVRLWHESGGEYGWPPASTGVHCPDPQSVTAHQ